MPDHLARALVTWAWIASLALPLACTPAQPADRADAPVPPEAASISPTPALDAGADASPPRGAGPPVSAANAPEEVDPRRLARALLRGDASLAYSPSTNTFVYLLSHTEEGNGTGLTFHVARAGEERPFEAIPVCEAYACASGKERELRIQAALPKVMDRVRGKGFAMLGPVRWPEGKLRMTLASPALALRWQRDHLVATRPGEGPVTFPPIKFAPQHKATPSAVAVVPDGTWIAVEIDFDPGSHYGEGFNVYSEVHTYRLP
jgi:hypothetical protein